MEAKNRQNVTIRMLPSLRDRMMIAAIKQRRKMSDLVNDACNDYLNTHEG